jgi:hypothetical protein
MLAVVSWSRAISPGSVRVSPTLTLSKLGAHPPYPKPDRMDLNLISRTALDGPQSAQPLSTFVAAVFQAFDAPLRTKRGTPRVVSDETKRSVTDRAAPW